MVAIPVQEMESTPGPKYSTIAPVPPSFEKLACLNYKGDFLIGTFNCENASDFQNNIFRRCPALKFTGEMNTNNLNTKVLGANILEKIENMVPLGTSIPTEY